MTNGRAENRAWIESIIRDFCASARNSLHMQTGEPAWAEPLICYARGDDPLFDKIKADIGPFYWTPLEAFRLAWPNLDVTAAELAVIVYVLPQTAATRLDQREATQLPAERWARSRFHGEEFNCALRLHLVEQLTSAGFPAGPEQMDSMLGWCDVDGEVTNTWQHLMEIATECNSRNLTNGSIIRGRKQQIDTGLAVVRGGSPRVDTYNRSGMEPGGTSLRPIAEA